MLRTSADWLAAREPIPTSLRAVLGYYGESGVFDVGSLRLKRRIDETTEAMIAEAFTAVERALAAEFGQENVTFSYDTKLVLPAQLTLGYLDRRLDDEANLARARELTKLAIEALIDGDMRDALNDDEYEDFEVDIHGAQPERVARIAQETLRERVEADFGSFDPTVRQAYDWAVEISEAHQDQDERFRELLAAASGGDESATRQVRDTYKHADFETEPPVFDPTDLEIPYLKTQYDRVGVIYDGMVHMYEEAGFDIQPAFARSIVLAIIGAQLWLDDIEDYEADRRDGQLTPVTAEYLLCPTDAEAFRSIVAVSEEYLERARVEATAAGSPLTGIATEYIYRSGEPARLPGAETG